MVKSSIFKNVQQNIYIIYQGLLPSALVELELIHVYRTVGIHMPNIF